MSRMSELSMLLDEVIATGDAFMSALVALRAGVNAPAQDAQAEEKTTTQVDDQGTSLEAEAVQAKTPAARQYTKEDVRGALAAAANEAGGRHKTQVRALVKNHSSDGSLSGVPSEQYTDLMKELEALRNG